MNKKTVIDRRTLLHISENSVFVGDTDGNVVEIIFQMPCETTETPELEHDKSYIWKGASGPIKVRAQMHVPRQCRFVRSFPEVGFIRSMGPFPGIWYRKKQGG